MLKYDPQSGKLIEVDDENSDFQMPEFGSSLNQPSPQPSLLSPSQPDQSQMNPQVRDYLSEKFGLGDYSDAKRQELMKNSQVGLGDKFGAALAAIGAGFQGKDAAAAGQAKLNAAKSEQRQKLEDFDKSRQMKIQDYDLNRKALSDERSDELISRERDPNSPESKMAQELAKQMGYPGDTSQLTADKFKSFSPALQKMYEIRERSLDRQESREQRNFVRDQARQDKLEQQAKPSEKQVKEFTEFDNALDSIKSIRSQKGQQDTGPLSAAQSGVAQFFGMDDSQKSAFKSEVQDQLAQYIKSISGGAVSDQERASLMQNIPKMSDNDKTFSAKLDALEARLERNRENHLKNLEKSGKNVKQFSREPSKSQYPKQVRKGNQVATVQNEQEEKEANDEGFQ